MLNMDIILDVKNYKRVSPPGTVTPTSSTQASTAGTGDTGVDNFGGGTSHYHCKEGLLFGDCADP